MRFFAPVPAISETVILDLSMAEFQLRTTNQDMQFYNSRIDAIALPCDECNDLHRLAGYSSKNEKRYEEHLKEAHGMIR